MGNLLLYLSALVGTTAAVALLCRPELDARVSTSQPRQLSWNRVGFIGIGLAMAGLIVSRLMH